MFYEAELRFLRDTFKKCRIQTNILDLSIPLTERQDLDLHSAILQHPSAQKPLGEALPEVKPGVIYRLTDLLFCQYMYLRLPELPGDGILLIGPFLQEFPTTHQLLQWGARTGNTDADKKQAETFYGSIPILNQTSQLLAMLDTFAEHLWGIGNYTVEEISQDAYPALHHMQEKAPVSEDKDALWNIRNMELRYSYENELMEAVSKGQTHKAELLFSNFSTFAFEQRLTDQVRNIKNYCIIMNTLLRKAAEQGGVHPVYLDSTSSIYAAQIEQLSSVDAVLSLMVEMFRSYCRLVRNHTLKDCSPPVQKAITYIDSDLTGNLSLRTISAALNVSGSYLSSLFKKETGQTLTEYITQRRIKHAMHLLDTTQMQVQTVAQHCGIVDVQYFSKMFKRFTGKTPKEYRASTKR